LEAGLCLALSGSSDHEWASVLTTAGAAEAYAERHGELDSARAIDFLLRDPENPSSVLSVIGAARQNARRIRTALSREVWEATNEAWMTVSSVLASPVPHRELSRVLRVVRQESAYVQGASHSTMMRNDIYDFARLGTFIERADNTARILDVKYYILLPSARYVGSRLDNAQWQAILASVSAERGYRWRHPGELSPPDIAEFLILDRQMPRALAFCFSKIDDNLQFLAAGESGRKKCHALAEELRDSVRDRTIASVFEEGLHEFLSGRIRATNELARQIEIDYRFSE
jgi:uncharacterized alpha-E superfamily protein